MSTEIIIDFNLDICKIVDFSSIDLKVVPMSLNMHKKTFKVDHPFVFFVRNKTAVFFAGRFVEPPKGCASCDQMSKPPTESMKVEISNKSD